VVTPVEDEDPPASRQLAREPDREAVRIRCRERELPARKAKAARQLARDPERVLARQHQGDPAPSLLRDGSHGRLGRVARHRSRVAEAEVDVVVAVDIAEARALRLGGEDREAARPADHPRHRDAGEEGARSLLGEGAGSRVLRFEALDLSG
jgi:hypothetical protein